MYEITLINSEFGQILNEEGDLYIQGTKEFFPVFESMDEVLLEKDRLLDKFIYASVSIKNLDTGEVLKDFYNETLGPKFSQEKKEYYTWAHLPFYKRLFKKRPVFKYYDGKH